jgi:hypothetical protein
MGQPRDPADFLWAMARPIPMGLRPTVVDQYAAFERKQLASGLPVWTGAGIGVLYAKQDALGIRCPVSRTFPDLAGPATAPAPSPAPSAGGAGLAAPSSESTAGAGVRALAAQARRIADAPDCRVAAASFAAARGSVPIGTVALSREIDREPALRESRVASLQDIVAAMRRCDRTSTRTAR